MRVFEHDDLLALAIEEAEIAPRVRERGRPYRPHGDVGALLIYSQPQPVGRSVKQFEVYGLWGLAFHVCLLYHADLDDLGYLRLRLHQLVEHALTLHQFGMCSRLNDLAFFKHDEP